MESFQHTQTLIRFRKNLAEGLNPHRIAAGFQPGWPGIVTDTFHLVSCVAVAIQDELSRMMPIADSISTTQPVVILGGFLISDSTYGPMAAWIHANTGAEVRIVQANRLDWLATSWSFGWIRLLDRVNACVQALQAESATGRVTLIGHSSGGVMLRAYLSDEAFLGRTYAGATRCNRLITLGSPHQAVRATPLRALVDQRFPGCPQANQVDYVAIAGRLDLNGANASRFSRRTAANSYRQISGDPQAPGDGLVPVSSALLRDARCVELEDTAHGGFFGRSWYGSEDRIGRWWSAL